MHTEARGRWRFVLEDIVTGHKTEASDCEVSDHVDRVSLLAVTRGLEALEQPSRVTLVTTSRYVARGLQYGLVEWRENDYCWEHFGSIQPIRNSDLWRRVDVALRFHEVQCRWMSQDSPAKEEPAVVAAIAELPHGDQMAQTSPESSEIQKRESDADSPEPNACPNRNEYTRTIDPEIALALTMSSHVADASDSAMQWTDGKAAVAGLERDPQRSSSIRIGSIYRAASEARYQDTAPIANPAMRGTAGTPSEHAIVHPLRERRLFDMRVSRPIHWVWNTILALDDFLVSCLRCLFLLDPRREHFRRRDY
jgi:ribonuclease HI